MKIDAKKITGKYYFPSSYLPLALKHVQGRLVTHAYDYTAVPHYHDFAELVIITGGSGRQLIADGEYPVRAGDVFVITDDTVHSFIDYQALKITNIMFDRKLLEPYEHFLAKIPGYQILFCLEPELCRSNSEFKHKLHLTAADLTQILEILCRMEKELSDKRDGFETAAISAFLELVVVLSRSSDKNSATPDNLAHLGKLLSALSANIAADWDLRKMAKFCSMSVNTLLRHFKKAMNRSPMQHLTKLRLEQSCNYLQESSKSISEIARECGFSDSNYFAKKFRAAYGMTASEFRSKNISDKKESTPGDFKTSLSS